MLKSVSPGAGTVEPSEATPSWPFEPISGDVEYGGGVLDAVFPRASRLFGARELYPPREFHAYGLVAFKSRASAADRHRHMTICQAYLAGLPHAGELDVSRAEQMVTVWPLTDVALARRVNSASLAVTRDPRFLERSELRHLLDDPRVVEEPEEALCELAVRTYDIVLAQEALRHAALAGADTSDQGPYLLAWSPSTDKGTADAFVLAVDLSNVTTYAQAVDVFTDWRSRIEQEPTVWRDGWNLELLRQEIRLWFDKYGVMLVRLFGT